MFGFQPSPTLNQKHYLFIDGGYFDKILKKIGKDFWNTDDLIIDYSKLKNNYSKVFYYNCLPGKRHNESDDDFNERFKIRENFYNELKLLDSYHVFEGVSFGRINKIRQKAVDIMIAVDMLRHSYRKNMDKASLLTGDLDFKPLLDALVLEGMHTSIIYSKESISNELLFAADSNQRITINQIHDWLPDKSKNFFKIPLSIPHISISNPNIISHRTSENEDFRLIKLGNNEFFLQGLTKNNVIISTWKFDDEERLISFYEDLKEIKFNY